MRPLAQQALLAYGFRPFFLLAAIHAMVAVFLWTGFMLGGWPLPLGLSPLQWHSHEMLYGFVSAAIAGFLLTAITNWTGAPPLKGVALFALVLLWVAGRVAMGLAGVLPLWLVALVDIAFLVLLALYVGRVLLRYRNRRNLVLVLVLTLLAAGNLWMHLGFIYNQAGGLRSGQQLGMNLITLLMAVIAGRIIPAFSANWLRAQGSKPDAVRHPVWIERLSLASLALLIPFDALRPDSTAVIMLLWLAVAAHALRLWFWRPWLVRREPLLWILHLAYGWIVLALLLRALSLFDLGIAPTVWQHALGTGAIGTLILGVMTRVALGHTGRPLKLPRGAIWIYSAITAAALLRLFTAAQWLNYYWGVLAAALAWALAFALFVLLYWPILSQPRPDGRPG